MTTPVEKRPPPFDCEPDDTDLVPESVERVQTTIAPPDPYDDSQSFVAEDADINKDNAVAPSQVFGPGIPPESGGSIPIECLPRDVVTADSIKDSNPKDALGIAKVPMSTIPVPVMMEVALGLMEGGLKYGRHNYRAIGIRFSVYYDAAMRHIGAWWEGEDIDAASGLSHVTKAIATLVVLRDAMIQDKFVDDRPPATLGFIEELNKKAAKLLEMYPEPKDPFLGTDYPPTEYRE